MSALVISGQTIARQNPPLSAVPQKQTKEPRRKPPDARYIGSPIPSQNPRISVTRLQKRGLKTVAAARV
jgi:hypothetical protein